MKSERFRCLVAESARPPLSRLDHHGLSHRSTLTLPILIDCLGFLHLRYKEARLLEAKNFFRLSPLLLAFDIERRVITFCSLAVRACLQRLTIQVQTNFS
jgi:hypothetical protein